MLEADDIAIDGASWLTVHGGGGAEGGQDEDGNPAPGIDGALSGDAPALGGSGTGGNPGGAGATASSPAEAGTDTDPSTDPTERLGAGGGGGGLGRIVLSGGDSCSGCGFSTFP